MWTGRFSVDDMGIRHTACFDLNNYIMRLCLLLSADNKLARFADLRLLQYRAAKKGTFYR